MKRSEELLSKASRWMKTMKEEILYASVGGSTARGETDEYSDIDLTLYMNDDAMYGSHTFIYEDEFIQVDMKPVADLPSIEAVLASPWDFRFLNELKILTDVDGRFEEIKGWAMKYYSSGKGRIQTFNQVANIIEERKMYALECLNQHQILSGLMAAMGAWSEAALSYQFFAYNDLSNDSLIRNIKKLDDYFHRFQQVAPFSCHFKPFKVASALTRFREYLRNQNDISDFALSKIQDELFERKAKRLIKSGEHLNLLWQAYSEGVWLYFETSNGKEFEAYFDELPSTITEDLTTIGFVPLSEDSIKAICKLSEELLQLTVKKK